MRSGTLDKLASLRATLEAAVPRTARTVCAALSLAAVSFPAVAAIIYQPSDWTTNADTSGNYLITVENDGIGGVDITATVDPWNAELLGIFFDLGDLSVAGATVTNDPAVDGVVTLFAQDSTSNECGKGCNLNGLDPQPPTPDGNWEFVFRLGAQGGNDLRQTYSWNLSAVLSDNVQPALLTIDEQLFGAAGVRGQNYCASGVLPGGDCDGSDKSFTLTPTGTPTGPSGEVPEPGSLALLAAGGLGLFARRRMRRG